MKRNVFSPRLREIILLDEYLVRLQRSLAAMTRRWQKAGLVDAAYVTRTLRARIVEIRAVTRNEIEALVEDIPVVHSARGVSSLPLLRFLQLALLIDIELADNPASLWRYCGLGVTHGVPDTILSGSKPGQVRYSTKARSALRGIRPNLMKPGRPYRIAYEQHRDEQLARGIPAPIAYKRAARYTMKLFLKHLWLVWRRTEGLPVGAGHPDDSTRLVVPFGWR